MMLMTVTHASKLNSQTAPLNPPPKVIFVSLAPPPNATTTWTNNGWQLLNSHSDEFNGTAIDFSKWALEYGGQNNYPFCLAWHDFISPYANHVFTTSGGNSVLRLVTKKEYVEKISNGYYPAEEFMSHDLTKPLTGTEKPNYRPFYYTSAMLRSAMLPSPYGYFEIRCKLPNARNIIADYWLFSANQQQNQYNEIDIFELTGRSWYATTHYQGINAPSRINQGQALIAAGAKYTDDFHIYAMKWEPHRISFYLDNILVRTVTEYIPDQVMEILINLGQHNDVGIYSPDIYPCYFDIDYVRTYQRNPSTPNNMAFTVNGSNSIVTGVKSGLPIWINGNQPTSFNSNYNTGGVYYFSVQQCDISGVGIGSEYGKWLTLAESVDLEKLDARAIASSLGLNIAVNNYYRIKLATGGVGWTEHVKRIQVIPCTNSVEFSINGEFRTNFTPINISYSDAEPLVMLNASLTQNCSGIYWLSVEPCLPNGDGSANGNTDEYGAWLNSTEIASLSNFDIRYFLASRFSQQINYGQHYRIKLMTGGNNTAKVVIINVQACTNNADFKINDQSRTDFTPVIISPGETVYMLTQLATICYDDFYLSVEPCNALGDGSANGNTDEIGRWMSYNNLIDKFDAQEMINISAFYQNNSPNSQSLQAGSYYRIKLGTQGVWSSKVIIIYMQPNYCLSSGVSSSPRYIDFFEMNGFRFISGDNNGYRDFTDHGLNDKENFVPKLSIGSTINFFISGDGLFINRYWRIWIDYNNDSQFQTTEMIVSQFAPLALTCQYIVPANVPLGKKRMRVSMGTVNWPGSCDNGFNGEVEDYSVNIADASGYSPYRSIDEQQVPSEASLNIFPTPSNGQFYIKYVLPDAGNLNIGIYDLQGKLVYSPIADSYEHAGEQTILVSNHGLAAGVYVAVMQTADRIKKVKFVITE